jgi:hypothetical protein
VTTRSRRLTIPMVALALSFGLVLAVGVLWSPGTDDTAAGTGGATPTAPSTPPSPAEPPPEDPPPDEPPPDDGASGSDAPGTITLSEAPDAPEDSTSAFTVELSTERTDTGQRVCVLVQGWTLADSEEWEEREQDGRTVRCRDFEEDHVLIQGDLP